MVVVVVIDIIVVVIVVVVITVIVVVVSSVPSLAPLALNRSGHLRVHARNCMMAGKQWH